MGPEPARRVLSWSPARGTNRRIDYLRRVLVRVGSDLDAGQVLDGLWKFLLASPVDWLRTSTPQGLGTVLQVDHELLRIGQPGMTNHVYACSRCRRIAANSVEAVCPAIGCDGQLVLYDPDSSDVGNAHYRNVYRTMNPVPLTAHEHTAQWKNTEAARVQQQFIHGETNALSCSTTFELGVDVGELQSVFLRNMPPTTANYVQRAGRAGRRTDSAALVVTFAQRRSHDLTRYERPEAMIAGKMRPPYVPLANPRIDRRHAHSVALAAFFRWLNQQGTRVRTAGAFFLPSGGSGPVHSMVREFLNPVPPRVAESLGRVLPSAVQIELGVDSGVWVIKLTELLDRIAAEIAADVELLEARVAEASKAKQFGLAGRFQRVINTVRDRELLGFLAARNVLPKYGFPVDSVELRTQYSTAEHDAGAKLDLSRDLAQAIYEYAPGSQVVAGGQLWTSGGIYRLPGKELQSAAYTVCERCGDYRESAGDLDPQCKVCGEVTTAPIRTHVIPEFGFVAAHDVRKPGNAPPRRSWAGGTHVLRLSDEPRVGRLEFDAGAIDTQVGPRGRLVAIAEGRNHVGFWICDWCGWGSQRAEFPTPPRKHPHLLKNSECTGSLRLLSLAHRYETDLLRLDVSVPASAVDPETWMSVLYALLEGASETLEIARDDIDGALVPTGPGSFAMVLFDRVPGGAGNVLRIESRLRDVLDAALHRVTTCECGPETSCYGCLRSFSNQMVHDQLSRGRAADLLMSLLETDERFGAEPLPGAEVSDDWAALRAAALTEDERDLLLALAEAHAPLPVQGHELPDGTPADLAWPDRRIAVVSCPVDVMAGDWACFDLEEGDVSDRLLKTLAHTDVDA